MMTASGAIPILSPGPLQYDKTQTSSQGAVHGFLSDGQVRSAPNQRVFVRMKQFFGCLAFGDAPLPSRLPQIPNSVTSSRTAIVAPLVLRDGALTIAIEGNPRLRGEARADGLPARILEAYRREGVAVLGRLGGPFAVAILDADAGDALLAIDRMGI